METPQPSERQGLQQNGCDTKARDEMFPATESSWAPWYVARSENKLQVGLNIISHPLGQIPYQELPAEKVKLPRRRIGRYQAID